MQEVWFPPNTPNSKIVGRFEDHTQEWVDSAGERRSRVLPYLYRRAPASNDVDCVQCKPNTEFEKLKKEWSAAWADYEKRKASSPGAPPIPTATEFGIKGTPIEEADFIGKDKLAFFKMTGCLTIEQLAEMSDSICQNIMGGKMIRKKAKEYLIVKADEAKRT